MKRTVGSVFTQKSFTLISHDGKSLVLQLFINNTSMLRTKRCVIYTHSHGSNKEEGLQLLKTCADMGYSLCLYDSRSCGASEHTKVTFGYEEQLDLLFVMYYVLLTEEVSKYVLWGRSIGCCAVIQLLVKLTSIAEDNYKNRRIGDSKYLQANLNKFFERNKTTVMLTKGLRFEIIGTVLDSPIKSLKSSILNFIKKKIVNVNFIANYASEYVSQSIKNQLNFDFDYQENEELLNLVNINSFVFFSKEDEFISLEDERYIMTVLGRNKKHKNPFKFFKLEKGHKTRRNEQEVKLALQSISDNKKFITFPYHFQVSNPINKSILKTVFNKGAKTKDNFVKYSYTQKKLTFAPDRVYGKKRGSKKFRTAYKHSESSVTRLGRSPTELRPSPLKTSIINKRTPFVFNMTKIDTSNKNPLNSKIIYSDIKGGKFTAKNIDNEKNRRTNSKQPSVDRPKQNRNIYSSIPITPKLKNNFTNLPRNGINTSNDPTTRFYSVDKTTISTNLHYNSSKPTSRKISIFNAKIESFLGDPRKRVTSVSQFPLS